MQGDTRECAGVTLDTETSRFVESGPGEISSRVLVFADFTRGTDLSATAIVMDPSTKLSANQLARAGTTITVGTDRYCITDIRATPTTATVSLRKVLSPL